MAQATLEQLILERKAHAWDALVEILEKCKAKEGGPFEVVELWHHGSNYFLEIEHTAYMHDKDLPTVIVKTRNQLI